MTQFEGPFTHPKGIVAVLDTSVLVRAWLSPVQPANPSRRVMLLAGGIYDSVTSAQILDEVRDVLVRPRFAVPPIRVSKWMDIFLRASRQVFPQLIPSGEAGAVGGDIGDLAVLHTAYAVNASGEELEPVLAAARGDGGWFLVSENTRDFVPGHNVYGWQFVTAHEFHRILVRRGVPPR